VRGVSFRELAERQARDEKAKGWVNGGEFRLRRQRSVRKETCPKDGGGVKRKKVPGGGGCLRRAGIAQLRKEKISYLEGKKKGWGTRSLDA